MSLKLSAQFDMLLSKDKLSGKKDRAKDKIKQIKVYIQLTSDELSKSLGISRRVVLQTVFL